ncbi:MAG TPA: MaoC/PaaZ C-terminal domain-containing protein, partial [Gemmatimonadaceae bacterium]|nr:MaoC/PaaZ C-terminal domain-containing protein [Gemmatimonadaceae bacterium]
MPRLFEELTERETLLSSERSITAADVKAFATLTGDTNDVHISDEFARNSRFGRRIAHGAYVFSVSLGQLWGETANRPDIIAIASVEKLRFAQPTFLGDRVRVRQTLVSLSAISQDAGLVEAREEVLNQDDVVVMTYTAKFLVR